MRIVFVRHCEPDYTVDSLTPKGWREAKLLSHRVLNWNVDAFTSRLLAGHTILQRPALIFAVSTGKTVM